MKKHNFKKVFKIGTLLAICLASRANAKAQGIPLETYYETNEPCKFINNKSRVVINHRDTLQVYGIDTIYRLGQEMIVCDLGPGKDKLIFDPLYYINNPWLPPIQKGDTVAYQMVERDIELANLFIRYNGTDYNESCRDSVETVMLENRRALAERATMNFQKQY